ncbi:hypothetical protein JCM6882_004008 [Rhodosporidiobolus microsporus]
MLAHQCGSKRTDERQTTPLFDCLSASMSAIHSLTAFTLPFKLTFSGPSVRHFNPASASTLAKACDTVSHSSIVPGKHRMPSSYANSSTGRS